MKCGESKICSKCYRANKYKNVGRLLKRKREMGILIPILLSFLIYGCSLGEDTQYAIIFDVTDSDTIVVNDAGGNEVIVRVLGIDAIDVSKDRIGKWQEMNLSEERIRLCYKEGIEKSMEWIDKEIVLISDPNEPDKDRYDRLLRYVTTIDNGRDFGSEMILGGYAIAYDPSKKRCQNCGFYKLVEEDTRKAKAGCLWK